MKKEKNSEGTLKSLIQVGLPIMIQYMLTSSIGLISSMMVGRLGDQAVAAMGIGNQFFFVYSLVVFGLFAGAGVLMSQLYGSGNLTQVRRTMMISAGLGVGVGVLFLGLEKSLIERIAGFFTKDMTVIHMVKSYMDAIIPSYVVLPIFLAFSTGFRSTRRSSLPMVISLVSVLINIVLAYGLIFGHWGLPECGIAGVGQATVVARVLEALSIVVAASLTDIGLRRCELLTLSPEMVGTVLQTAAPVVINELCWGLGMVIYNILYGHIGLQALTAIQINSVLQNFFMTLVFGASGATAILVGNAVGSGSRTSAVAISKTILRVSMPLSVIMGGAMILSAQWIMPFYSVTEGTRASFLAVAWTSGVMMPIKFFAVLMITGILRGGGDTVYTMYLELGTMWLIGVPVALMAVHVFALPVQWAFALVFIEDLIKCVLAYRRYRSMTWMTDLTVGMTSV